MKVITYAPKTRQKVEVFLRRREKAFKHEILNLGGTVRKVNWESLEKILKDLLREKKIRVVRVGRARMFLYEWIM